MSAVAAGLTAWSVVLGGAASVRGIVAVGPDRWRPVVFSWVVWAALMGEGAKAGAGLPAQAFGWLCAAAAAVIAWKAWRIPPASRERAPRLLGVRWDAWCAPPALAGLVLLAFTRDPGLVVAITVATDAFAYLPTLAHCWKSPAEEDGWVYGLYGIGAGAGLAAVTVAGSLSLTSAGYLAYLALFDCGAALMIVTPRFPRAWVTVPVLLATAGLVTWLIAPLAAGLA